MTSNNKSSFGQALHFITDIKLQELEKQRLSYQDHAKILEDAEELGKKGDILKKVEVLAKAAKTWVGSGALSSSNVVGGKIHLDNLELWLRQARHDPSFSRDIAVGWADTLEEHIRHNVMRLDSAKLFGGLFNEWLASGDSAALAYQADSDVPPDTGSSDYVEVGRKEMYEQKEKLSSIIFDDYPVDVKALNVYLEDLFSSEQAAEALERLRRQLRGFSNSLLRESIDEDDVTNAITGLLSTGLLDEEKRATLKAFQENSTVLEEVASVLNMRLASLESWSWPKEGLLIEFRRHLNGKYRAFTDPDIIDALLLHHLGIAWQVELKKALTRVFESKAWIRPTQESYADRTLRKEQLPQNDPDRSIEAEREKIRKDMFFLTQLQDSPEQINPYDDLVDAPTTGSKKSPAMVKQKLLHILTTECYLNTTLYGTHALLTSDIEWFGPSLPHASILTILEFIGVSKTWLLFFRAFLSSPLRFPGELEPRMRKRGIPISYSLGVLFGEAVIFIMDLAVNQRANGLFLHRMHDDLWLWDSDVKKVSAGWSEMNKYATLVGIKFNEKKTGSAYVGPQAEDATGLPKGFIHWGFLEFDPKVSRFVINKYDIDLHVMEMRRQLDKTRSVFGWVNTYNKFMAFFMRNLGGVPAYCFGKDHIQGLVDTLAYIQRQLFPEGTGSAVGYLRKVVAERFGVTDLPEGYFYFPISSGGLELRNTLLEVLALDITFPEEQNSEDEAGVESYVVDNVFQENKALGEDKFPKRVEHDIKEYQQAKEAWEAQLGSTSATPVSSRSHRGARRGGITSSLARTSSDKDVKPFMSFEEYISLRESGLSSWGNSYRHMLDLPPMRSVVQVPKVRELMEVKALGATRRAWSSMDWYEQWIVSLYGEEVVSRFGALEAVDRNLIPVGMVQLFRSSRINLDQ
ncbi:hypothetical protein CVT26_000142 [Gymnopilus dilepis]|uniref:Reverse transcriptase domain-containing protein n=1 Tax=Gymnopilus dilepis TaxID=231916 RepID=A0A409WE32_9AGAR|nr:hypothetical protein CVT26_000142 [Gymnopilus dilepis]